MKKLNNIGKKYIVCGVTATAMAVAACSAGTFARSTAPAYSFERQQLLAGNVLNEDEAGNVKISKKEEDELVSSIISGIDIKEKEIYKDETVYAFTDPSGKITDVLVNEVLKNKDKASTLTDVTDLKDIENVKGDETFTLDGDKVTWQANGNDITYQGKSDKELPVQVGVTYYLDGKEMKPEEIAGKSGNVKIRFDYKNTATTKKEINGKQEEINIPFVAVSGMVLGDNFSNISVTNGKYISEGQSQLVIGYAVPGLMDSLDVDPSDFKDGLTIPDYFEVSADVTDFSLDMTLTVVMDASNMDVAGALDFSEVDEMVEALSDASNQLAEGTGKLADGSGKLADGSGKLLNGAGQLADGSEQLVNGAGKLADGSEQLVDGTGKLADGSGKLSDGLGTLVSKLGDYSKGINALDAGIDELAANSGALASGVTEIDSSAKTISNGIVALDNGLNTPMTDAEKQAIIAQVAPVIEGQFAAGTDTYNYIYSQAASQFTNAITGSTDAIYQQLLGSDLYTSMVQNATYAYILQVMQQNPEITSVDDAIASCGGLANIQAAVAPQVQDALSATASSITNGIASMGADKIGQSVVSACKDAALTAAGQSAIVGAEGAKTKIAGQIEAKQASGYSLVTGAQALAAGTGTLSEKIPTLTDGISKLAAGSDQIVAGTSQIVSGTGELATGADQLSKGVNELSTGANQLSEGVNELSTGANQLSVGANALVLGAKELNTGANDLATGADTLDEGMKTFNTDGIGKLVSAYNGDIKSFSERIRAIVEASTEYDTYTKLENGKDGTTKFIIKIAGISAPETDGETE